MYYNDFFNNNINNMKNTWKGIRQIINLNPKSFHAPTKIIKDNIELKLMENLSPMLLMISLLTLVVN